MIADYRKTFKAVIAVLFLSPTVFASSGELIRPVQREPDINRIIHQMEQVRKDITDLVAVVDHTVVGQSEQRPPATRISLRFKSPDKLKTQVAGGREVLISGDRMWVYSPDIEVVEAYILRDEEQRQATIDQMSWGLTSPIRDLLRGTERSVRVLDDGNYLVTVIPDQAEAEIERVQAEVDPRTWLIRKMKISGLSGSPVELKISGWKINTGLSDSLFEFRLPEGAELFEPLESGGEVLQ